VGVHKRTFLAIPKHRCPRALPRSSQPPLERLALPVCGQHFVNVVINEDAREVSAEVTKKRDEPALGARADLSWPTGSRYDQSRFVGGDHRLRPVAQPKLAQHVADMCLHGLLGDEEPSRYLRI